MMSYNNPNIMICVKDPRNILGIPICDFIIGNSYRVSNKNGYLYVYLNDTDSGIKVMDDKSFMTKEDIRNNKILDILV